MLTSEQVIEALKPIMDPEIRLGIVDLGLVYGADFEDEGKKLTVRMTLTSPMCPYGPMLLSQVQDVISCLPGISEAKVALVWDPPWNPREMASDEAKDALNIW
jgi:metal-sulfur cluster biosynthetic enzyme